MAIGTIDVCFYNPGTGVAKKRLKGEIVVKRKAEQTSWESF